MSKRGNTEGSVYQRGSSKGNGDGRWVGAVTLAGGKRKTVYADTRAEAAKKLTALLKQKDDGLPVISERRTVSAYLTEWLEGARPNLRHGTARRYDQLLRVHALPYIGAVPLARLTPARLQALFANRINAGFAPATVRQLRAVMHKAFRQAVEWGALIRNPLDVVSAPKVERRELSYLTPEQVRTLIDAAQNERLGALWIAGVTAGPRLGELLALRWKDISLDKGTLHVCGTLQLTTGGGFAIEPPKTARSRRTIPLTAVAIEALRRHKIRQAEERLAFPGEWAHPEQVFTGPDGAYIDGRSLRYVFEPFLTRAGLQRIRIHDLRHSAATFMLAQGIHPRIVSDILGHSTTALTMDVYSHVTEGMTRSAMAGMDAALAVR